MAQEPLGNCDIGAEFCRDGAGRTTKVVRRKVAQDRVPSSSPWPYGPPPGMKTRW